MYRRLILIGSITFVVFLSLYFFFFSFNKKDLVKTFKEKINSNAYFTINYSSLEFSLFKNFPNLSVILMNPSICYKQDNTNDSALIRSSSLLFSINFLDALFGKFTLADISSQEGVIFLDSRLYNLISKISKEANTGDNLSLLIKNLSFTKHKIIFKPTTSSTYLIYLSSAKFTDFQFRDEGKFAFTALTDSIVSDYSMINPFIKNPIEFSGLVMLSRDLLQTDYLTIKANRTSFESRIIYSYSEDILKISLEKNGLQISKFKDYFHYPVVKHIKNGLLNFRLDYLVYLSKYNSDNANISFSINDLSFSGSRKQKLIIENLAGSIIYKPRMSDCSIFIKHFNLLQGKSSARGEIKLINFIKPSILINSEIDIKKETMRNYSASFFFNIKGNLKTIIHSDTKFELKKLSISHIIAKLSLSEPVFYNLDLLKNISLAIDINDDLLASEFSGSFDNSPVIGSFSIHNFLQFVNIKKSPNITVLLDLKHLNYNTISNIFKEMNSSESSSKLHINYMANVKIDNFFYNDTLGIKNFFCVFNNQNNSIQISRFNFSSSAGDFNGSAIVDNQKNLRLETMLKNIDLKKTVFLYSSLSGSNFKLRNISSSLSGKVDLCLNIDSLIKRKYNDIQLNAQISSAEGSISGLSQFGKIASITKLKEIERINFQTFNNNILLKKGVLCIPAMTIQSNLLDLNIAGNYELSGEYSFLLNFKLKDLLKKKYIENNKNTEYEYDSNKNINLYFKLTGYKYNYSITYDKKSAFTNFSKNIKQESLLINRLLKDELSMKKKDSSFYNDSNNHHIKIPDSTKNAHAVSPFRIEWDEFDTSKNDLPEHNGF